MDERDWETLPDYVKEKKKDILEAQQSGPRFAKGGEIRYFKLMVLG